MQFRSIGAASICLLSFYTAQVPAACCYFAAKDKDINQPAQKAFITWEPDWKSESFTVQPRFEGNAEDFGMVIPTPARPKLDEMPRDFFKELAVFTILEPMDLSKYKQQRSFLQFAPTAAAADGLAVARSRVVVLEAGVVGSLDYKIVQADHADDLFQWLKENHYSYSGDEQTLDFYVHKKWVFTTMKIDPKQMKKAENGNYIGDVTPTRFTFKSESPVYPLRITRISVKDKTEALFYVQAPAKMDLPVLFSYEDSFTPMWNQALSYAIPEKVTPQEKKWRDHVGPQVEKMMQFTTESTKHGQEPATLEWAKKLTLGDLAVLTGETKYNRQVPAEDVANLKILKGHLKNGQFLTKFRKVFTQDEMTDDLQLYPADVAGKADEIEYFSILPTSPP